MAQETWRTSEAHDDVNSAPHEAVSKDWSGKKTIEDALSLMGQPTQKEVEIKEVTSPQKPIRNSPRKEINARVDTEPTLGQCFGNITVGKGNSKRIAREKAKTQA